MKKILLVCTTAFFWHCNSSSTDEAPTPKSCTERGDSLASVLGNTTAYFQIKTPNGGEVLQVGDTLHITALSNLNEDNAVLDMIYFQKTGPDIVTLNPSSKNLNLYQNCHLDWVIPDSVSVGGKNRTALGDSIVVRARHYTLNDRFDKSDAVFRISAK